MASYTISKLFFNDHYFSLAGLINIFVKRLDQMIDNCQLIFIVFQLNVSVFQSTNFLFWFILTA